jgi:type II secretory pathway component GspD/PulD (secretin)
VTPYINSENRITMDLHPEVSDLSSQATVQGGVIFTTTMADTRIMVDDGETAVIGGLIRTSEIEFEQGVPILKSIPWLGALFRSSDVRKESRELLIFVSPRVVEKMASNP